VSERPALATIALRLFCATLCAGVPHPPGYPTWTLLAHAFVWLPLRGTTPAWRVNLSSAVFDALASGVLCATVGLWSRDTWAGLAAGGAFAFAPLVWQYAVQCEVFALNNLLCACMLLALVCYDAQRTLGRACAGALTVGLALTNQHTALFFAAPFALWTLCVSALPAAPPARGSPPRNDSLLRPAPLLRLGACGLLGLSPYLYLVMRGGDSAAWGSWGAQHTVRGFLTHLLRREYGTFRLANTPETTDAEFWLRLYSYLASIQQQLPPHGAPLAAIGLARSLTSRSLRHAGRPVLAGYVTYVLVFHLLANLPASSPFFLAIQQRFWPQANLLVSAWFGIGAAHAARRLIPRAPAASAACLCLGLVAWHAAGGGAGQPASLLALLGMPDAGGGTENAGGGFRPADCVGTDLFDQFGLEVLRALPDEEDVILLTNGDEVLNSVRYAHRVLHVKPRLLIVDQNYAQFSWFVRRARTQSSGLGRVAFPGEAYGSSNGSFLMSELLDANYARFRFYVCGGMHPQDASWQSGYRLWPMGAVSQILRRDAPVDVQAWVSRSKQLLPRLSFSREPEAGSWAQVIARNHYLPAYALRPYALLQQVRPTMFGPRRPPPGIHAPHGSVPPRSSPSTRYSPPCAPPGFTSGAPMALCAGLRVVWALRPTIIYSATPTVFCAGLRVANPLQPNGIQAPRANVPRPTSR